VEKVQGISGIVDKINALTLNWHEPEQRSCAWRISGAIQKDCGNLQSSRRTHNQETIISVNAENVPVCPDCQTERIVQVPAFCNGSSFAGGRISSKRI
jgi:hypothetical protein